MARKTLAALLVAFLPLAAQAADDRWIHVAVDGDDETVRVNLPVTVALAAVPLVAKHADTELDLGGHDLDKQELQQLLTALRSAQDGEYVTVDDGEDHVRVHKQGDFLLVNVNEKAKSDEAGKKADRKAKGGEDVSKGERVEVKLPLEVVAALLSGEGDELNIAAAIDALAKHDTGSFVTVQDGEETVRVWIDRKPSS